MKRVAKVVVIDPDDSYLLLERSDHPTFPNDPDLPGGTVEDNEDLADAAVREVYEETCITLDKERLVHVYTGTKYSGHNTEYTLYICRVATRPPVTISWEHDSYVWLGRNEFLSRIAEAADTFMHMVYHEGVDAL